MAAHHPDDVHTVLAQTERTYTKDTIAFRVMADKFGDGLLTTTGDEWRRQRRIVQPLSTPRRGDGYATLMAEEATTTCAAGPFGRRYRRRRPADDVHTLRVVRRVLFGDRVAGWDDFVSVLDALVPQVSSTT